MITSKSTDSSFIRYLLNVRAPMPFVCPCSCFLSIPAYHYGSFYHLLRKGKPKIHILDCCSFVSYFPFWREILLIPNSTSSETVHQHRLLCLRRHCRSCRHDVPNRWTRRNGRFGVEAAKTMAQKLAAMVGGCVFAS